MTDQSPDTQALDSQFIARLIASKTPVTLFLLNGVKLQGLITQETDKALILERENLQQLVYKHALSTIMPATTVRETP